MVKYIKSLVDGWSKDEETKNKVKFIMSFIEEQSEKRKNYPNFGENIYKNYSSDKFIEFCRRLWLRKKW